MEKEKKTPKEIKITSVVEVTYISNDCELIPNREVKEFWTLDGRKIGQFDLLDEFLLIIDNASFTKYSDESN